MEWEFDDGSSSGSSSDVREIEEEAAVKQFDVQRAAAKNHPPQWVQETASLQDSGDSEHLWSAALATRLSLESISISQREDAHLFSSGMASSPPALGHNSTMSSGLSSAGGSSSSSRLERVSGTARGTYSRDGAARRVPHDEQRKTHLRTLSDVFGACSSSCGCTGVLSPNVLKQCHEYSYGSPQAPFLAKRTHEAWLNLVDSFFTYDSHGKPSASYKVGGYACCAVVTRMAYGITESKWNALHALARKGPGALLAAKQTGEWDREARRARQAEKVCERRREARGVKVIDATTLHEV